MAAAETAARSKRDQHVERLRKKYPEKKFEDDEELFGQIGADYDAYEAENSGYKEREQKLSDMFAADPRSAELLVGMSNGENFAMSFMKKFGPDIKDTLDDPEKMQEVADAWAEDQKRIAKSKQLDDEWAKNMEQSMAALEAFQQERGLSDEQVNQVFYGLIEIVRNGVMGKFDQKGFEFALNAINHDGDVAMAQEEGTIAGKNQRVTEQLRKSRKGDGVAQLGSKNNSGSIKRDSSIFDLASAAQ